MATIQDVAILAGVSPATVSRVLNNSFIVTAEKRERVLAAVESVGYTPPIKVKKSNPASNKIIIVIASIYLPELFRGVQDCAMEQGIAVVLCAIGDYEEGCQAVLQTLRALPPDIIAGFVLCNVVYGHDALRPAIERYPVVQIDRQLCMETNYIVTSDNAQAFYQLASHLVGQGRRRIAFAAPNALDHKKSFIDDRFMGYQRALREHGLAEDPSLLLPADASFEGGMGLAKDIRAMQTPPDAVMCVTDKIAFGLVSALPAVCGLRIPQDIAVTGFDNEEYSACCYPALTTVEANTYEIGVEAASLVTSIHAGRIAHGRQVFIPHEIILRASTEGIE